MLHQLAQQLSSQYNDDKTVPDAVRNFINSFSKASEHPDFRRIIEPFWPFNRFVSPPVRAEMQEFMAPFEQDVLSENSNTVLFSINVRESRFTNISLACESIYGYSAAEFYENYNLWKKVVHPDDLHIIDMLGETLSKGRVVIAQYRVIKRDDNIRWIENKFIPTLDQSGRLTKIDGISIDRTDSFSSEKRMRENEQRLIESEKKYRIIFENNPQPMWVLDNDSLKLIDVNAAASLRYGYSKMEFLSMSAYDLRTPDESARLFTLETTNKGKINNTGLWEIKKKDGTVCCVDITAELIDFEGKPARLILAHDVTEQIEAEKKLKLSNERYELVTRATNDAIWDWNLCRNKLYWSEGYEKLFGYRNESQDVNVHSWTSRIHPEDVQRVSAGLMKKINDSDTDFWEDEYRYMRADGSVAFIHDRGFIKYEEGIPVRMVGAMQDITNRKKTEEFLHKSEANLRNLLENTDTAYILLDESARVVSLNRPARILADKGIIADVLVGKNYVDVVPASRKKEVKKALAKIMRTGKPESYEVYYSSSSGMSNWLHVSIHPVLNKQRVLIGFSVAINNITERKVSEQLLKESEANLRTIFDNTDRSFIFLDKEFGIVSFNQRAANGVKNEKGKELKVGKKFNEYFASGELSALRNRNELVLKGKKVSYEKCFQQADGTEHWYDMSFLPVLGDGGNLFGIIITADDITERKNIELEKERITSELLLRNKTLEQFAYIISHNLRSPVANITGLANIILSSSSMNKSDYQRCMEGLALSVKKLDDVIIDLNYILQVRRKSYEKKENINFIDVITDIKTSINSIITNAGVTISTNFAEAEEILSIKSYLNSIFYNLIVNSIKYRDSGKPTLIEVSSRKKGDKLLLVFRDNGLGIDLAAHGNKIFGLYKKFHNHVDGKGMGLYMVKTQVELLDGKIEVKSEVNKGTEFTIEFQL